MFPYLLAAAGLLFAYLTWRDLRLGLFLIAAVLPAYLIRFSLFSLPATLLEIFIITLIIIWLIKRRFTLRSDEKWFFPIIFLLLAAAISIFVAPDKITALGVWKAYFLEPILIFIIALDLLKTRANQARLIWFLSLGALFVAAFAIFQKITLFAIPAPWSAEGRVTSVFPYPNAVGLYLGPIFILNLFSTFLSFKLADFSFRISNLFRFSNLLFRIFSLTLMILAIIFAQTEAAYFAIPAAAVLILILFTKYRRPALAASLIILALIAIFPQTRQTAWQKISLQDYSGTVRTSQWSETWAMLQDRPLWGAGLSGYPSALAPYHARTDLEIFQYPHNIFLNVWTELGLLGLLAFFWVFCLIAKRARGLNTQPAPWLALAAAAALLEILIHGLVDVPYFKNDLAVLTWLIIALFWLAAPKRASNP